MTNPANAGAANVDTLHIGRNGNSGSGPIAMRMLQSGLNIEELRTQDVLRLREWQNFDTVVIEVARQRLVAVGDLISAGLTYEVPNALGILQVQWERFSDLGPASVSMSGLAKASNDRFEIDLQSVPMPIVHKDFQINIRALESGRNLGTPLDTTQAALAARIVSETIEGILFNGSTVGSAGNTISGYTTFTSRVTGSLTASWLTQAGTVTVNDVLSMIEAAYAQNMYGPYMLYVPANVFAALGNDYKAYSDLTILQRIMQVPGIIGVRPTSNLTVATSQHSSAVLVQFTSDVVDIIDGIQPTVVQWETEGGFLINFKVLSIMVPRMKADKSGQCGIIHYSV